MKREVDERYLKRTPAPRSRPTTASSQDEVPPRHLATEYTAARVRRGLGERSMEKVECRLGERGGGGSRDGGRKTPEKNTCARPKTHDRII